MKKFYFILFILILFTSCGSIILSLMTPNNLKKSLKVMKKNDYTVIFMPMVHVAKPDFYNKAKTLIDSLKKENYTIFYESITFDKKYYNENIDSITKNELFVKLRKYRKMIGTFHANDLTDKKNKSLPNYMKNKKFVSQTNELLGIDSLDVNADVTMTELINAHEKEEGEIILTDCDYNTGFYEKYKCEKVNSYYAINTFREDFLFSRVTSYNKKKSVIVYGKGHWYFIWADFRDAGYELLSDL